MVPSMGPVRGVLVVSAAALLVGQPAVASSQVPRATAFHSDIGHEQLYVVPKGVALVTVSAVGAPGGGQVGLGGSGLQLRAALPVHPDERLYTIVGDTCSIAGW